MIEKEGIKPENLISFGDGYVEIELVSDIGGYAVGAATDETRRCGIDSWKRNRLLSAGAMMIIPDFADYKTALHQFDHEQSVARTDHVSTVHHQNGSTMPASALYHSLRDCWEGRVVKRGNFIVDPLDHVNIDIVNTLL